MLRSKFRKSKFRSASDQMGEDVNPSAYIVNLADCMLVLACGFMVAMVVNYQIDISAKPIDQETMEEVDPSTMPEDITSEGSSYIEAGKVYMDPTTGDLYMIRESGSDATEGSSVSGETSSNGESASASGSPASGTSTSGSASAPGFGMPSQSVPTESQ